MINLKPTIWKIVGDNEKTLAYDKKKNILNIYPGDRYILGTLIAMGYTNKELKKIKWRYKLKAGVCFLKYCKRGSEVRLELDHCKLENKKIQSFSFDYNKIKIIEWDRALLLSERLADYVFVPGSDFNNIFEPFKSKPISRIRLGANWVLHDMKGDISHPLPDDSGNFVEMFDEDSKILHTQFQSAKTIIHDLNALGWWDELEEVEWEYVLSSMTVQLEYSKGGLVFKKRDIPHLCKTNEVITYTEEITIEKIEKDDINSNTEKVKLSICDHPNPEKS